MEEGEGQEGKVQELLEASDIKKIIIELSKSKKRHFFRILLLLEFYLKVVFSLKNRKDLLHF